MTLEYLNLHVVKPTKTADTNLVTNPSFELNTTGWTAVGGAATADTTTARWGYQSLAVTCTTAVGDGVYFGTVALTDTNVYTFSLDVKGAAGIPYKITVGDTSANLLGTATTFTGTGYWDRQYCVYTATATESVRLYVLKNNSESILPFYIDGIQFELRSEQTTYFDGDQEDCYWSGQAHASTSVRLATTRRGGTLVDLSDYMHISSFMGLGMNPYNITKQMKADGRSLFQRTLKRDREVILTGELICSNYDDLQTNRKAILDLFKPDYVTGDQDVTIRYQGTTSAGLPASENVFLRVRMRSDGMLGNWNKPTQENLALIFEAYDDLYADGENAAVLDYNDTLANADYIVYQDKDGVWHSMAGVTGTVYAIAQHPITKVIYVGGYFTDAGADANADYLAMWNGSAWVAVVAGCNATINDLKFDSSGNLYIGGGFTDWGDANGDRIVKWDGSSLSSLGTGLNEACHALAIDSSGNLYAGGNFTLAGGVANTVRIAKWDGSVWTPLSTGILGTVLDISADKSNNLYIVGSFTDTGDANGDYVVKWTGSAWESLGTGSNALLYSTYIDSSNNLYVGGDTASLGGVTVGRWGRWNGQKWEALGSGFDNTVFKIFGHNNKIYISGGFTTAGGVAIANRLAEYLGNGIYKPFDINLPGTPTVYDLVFDNLDNLYVGYDTSSATNDAETAGDTDVTVTGTATHPKFTITGAGILRQIVNSTNGDAVYFNNFTLLSNEVVTLDFERGIFTSNFRGNILTYILEGISTLNFKLDPGTNRIATFIDGTTDANTKAVMTWKTRYWSIDEAKR